eukprot:364197-Chlamydomonas_euryale.AAC.39
MCVDGSVYGYVMCVDRPRTCLEMLHRLKVVQHAELFDKRRALIVGNDFGPPDLAPAVLRQLHEHAHRIRFAAHVKQNMRARMGASNVHT